MATPERAPALAPSGPSGRSALPARVALPVAPIDGPRPKQEAQAWLREAPLSQPRAVAASLRSFATGPLL